MKRAIGLLARLYPSRWRARYGEEFNALIEDAGSDAYACADVLKGAIKMQFTHWSGARIAILSALTGALVAAGIALSLPDHYVSQAVVQVTGADERSALQGALVRTFSRTTLAMVINDLNLYTSERTSMSIEDVIEKMKEEDFGPINW